jgi:hypothetical protein
VINRLLTPILIAMVIGFLTTISLFFGTAAGATGPGETSIALGPLKFMSIVRVQFESGSSVEARPGLGLLVVWLALLAYGITMGVYRYRQAISESGPPA